MRREATNMAARWLSGRLLQHLTRSRLQTPVFQEASCQSLLLTNLRRGIQTESKSSIAASEVAQKASEVSKTDAQSTVKYGSMSDLKVSARHDLAMVFTCKVCETRSMKTCCRESYEKGVVVVRCGGCNNLHLIADRLGWFGEPGSIEELLASRGEGVKKGSIDSLNFTLEDLAGKKL